MGFFSGLFSAIGTFASRLWEKTKEIVAQAVGWLADKAEVFAGAVSKAWKTAKEKYVVPALVWAREQAPWPWLKSAISVFEDIILRFGDSPLGKKLKEAIEWAIKAARDLRSHVLSAAELSAARIRKAVFGEAGSHLSEDGVMAIRLAERINDYVLVQSTIAHVLETNNVDSFEHYLRLRAAQKLLRMTEQTLSLAQTLEAIGEDDHFLLDVADNLLSPQPQLTDADAARLDGLVRAKLGGRGLIPFVFEEMVKTWQGNVDDMVAEHESRVTKLSQSRIRIDDLEMNIELGNPVSAAEMRELADLRAHVSHEPSLLDGLAARRRELKYYVDAAKGFLQILEGKLDDRAYVADEACKVGKIIIDCAQHDRPWNDLSENDQALIVHFANIFVEVEVGA